LAWATRALTAAGSPSPELDALSLLMRALGTPHAIATSCPDHPFPRAIAHQYAAGVLRRAAGEPVAYIVGHKAFMGLDLLVDQRVFLVRRGTERMVEAALEMARLRPDGAQLLAADIGTGSGAIALALASLEPRFARVYAVDASADALAVARQNGTRYRLEGRVLWLEGNLLEPVPEPVDLIISNLPTLPASGPPLAPEVARYEPERAFFGGEDGLALLRDLLAHAPAKLRPGGMVALEIQPEQGRRVRELLAGALPTARVWCIGPAGAQRFLFAQVGWDTPSAGQESEERGAVPMTIGASG
jgi:release factor glutamine methyltransferase